MNEYSLAKVQYIYSWNKQSSVRAWHYWVSPYWTYLHNSHFEKYVCQGYLNSFPDWDNQGALFAYAKLYRPDIAESITHVRRVQIVNDSKIQDVGTYDLTRDGLYEYLGVIRN